MRWALVFLAGTELVTENGASRLRGNWFTPYPRHLGPPDTGFLSTRFRFLRGAATSQKPFFAFASFVEPHHATQYQQRDMRPALVRSRRHAGRSGGVLLSVGAIEVLRRPVPPAGPTPRSRAGRARSTTLARTALLNSGRQRLISARRVARRVFSSDSRGNWRRMGAIRLDKRAGTPRESEMASHSM